MMPPIAGADDNMSETSRTDKQNVFGEDRQQRAKIAKTDDDEVQKHHGENQRLGEKKFNSAEHAGERKFFRAA